MRAGWAFYASKANQFSLMTEAIGFRAPDGATATGFTLALGWQYF